MTQQEPGNDYPLSEVPTHARKGLASTAMVLLGFTFFTATMFAGGKLGMSANGPLAAVVGQQSPFHAQRSLVALLASTPTDYGLLRDALTDSGKQEAFAGAVTLIRTSGVSSHVVGEPYYVGKLPWWLLLWFHLSAHPVLLAFLAAASVVLFAIVLWRALRWAAGRRLSDAG